MQSTTISIAPRGYTLRSSANDEDERCRIALERLAGNANEYRLGNVFLRNFYTALDYDNDLIIIGINKGMASVAMASIEGRVYNPFKPRYTAFKVVLIFFYLSIIAGGIAYYIHRRKELEQETYERNVRLYGGPSAPAEDSTPKFKEENKVQDEPERVGRDGAQGSS